MGRARRYVWPGGAKSSGSDLISAGRRREGEPPPSWRAFIPAGLMTAIGMAGLAFATLSIDDGSGRYIVIAAPGARMADMVDILRAADGRLVEAGRFSNIAVAWSDRPDFAALSRRSGALFTVAAPDGGGCYGSSVEGGL